MGSRVSTRVVEAEFLGIAALGAEPLNDWRGRGADGQGDDGM